MALIPSMYTIQYAVHDNKDELMCSNQKLI